MDYKVRVHSPDHDGIAKLYVEAWVGPIPKDEVRKQIIYQQIFFSRILSGLLSKYGEIKSEHSPPPHDSLSYRKKEVHAKKNDDRLWPIIVAHERISETNKNYDRKNVNYCWSSLCKKNDDNIVGTHDRQ